LRHMTRRFYTVGKKNCRFAVSSPEQTNALCDVAAETGGAKLSLQKHGSVERRRRGRYQKFESEGHEPAAQVESLHRGNIKRKLQWQRPWEAARARRRGIGEGRQSGSRSRSEGVETGAACMLENDKEGGWKLGGGGDIDFAHKAEGWRMGLDYWNSTC
jgi:hypothetical protein